MIAVDLDSYTDAEFAAFARGYYECTVNPEWKDKILDVTGLQEIATKRKVVPAEACLRAARSYLEVFR